MTDQAEGAAGAAAGADRTAAARAAREANRAAAKAQAQAQAADAAQGSELTHGQKLGKNQEAAKAAKIAKLKAARAAKKADIQPTMVNVRVLKKGDSMISTGEHIGGLGDLTYDYGEHFETNAEHAKELEDRGFVEIVD